MQLKYIRSGIIVAVLASWLTGGQTPAQAQVTEYTWDGGGTDDNWSSGANWSGDNAPPTTGANRLIFDGTTRVTPNAETAYALDSILIPITADPFTVAGGTLTLSPANSDDGIQAQAGPAAGKTQRIDNDIVLGANARFSTLWNPDNINQTFTLDLRGNINLQGNTLALQYGRYSHTHYLRGNISGTGKLNMVQAVVHLTGANNTFSGGTSVNGALYTYNNNSLGTGPVDILGGVTISIYAVSDARTFSNDLTIGNPAGGNNGFVLTQNNFTFNGNVTLAGASAAGRQIVAGTSFPASAPTITWNGDIGENEGVPRPLRLQGRDNSGHIFNGVGSYTDLTRLESASGKVTAYFNGDFTASSEFIVQGTTTLRGTGTISDLTVEENGILAPGGQAAVGTLTVAGDATLANNTLFRINLESASSDRLAVSAGLTLGDNVTLQLLGALNGLSSYTVATFGTLAGTLGPVTLNGSAQDFADSGYFVVYGADSIMLTIPEPGTLAILMLGGGLLWARRRQRRRGRVPVPV